MRTIVTPPTVEPLLLPEAKLFLRVDGSEEDSLITMLIAAARRRAEFLTGRYLISQDWKITLDGFPFEVLDPAVSPIQQVVGIAYYDKTNAQQTVVGSKLIQDQFQPLIYPPDNGWPQSYSRPDAVSFTLRLGYGDTGSSVPEEIKQWMLLRIATAFENREALASGLQELPRSHLDGLLDGCKVTRF